jgi:general secretion pathway protein B
MSLILDALNRSRQDANPVPGLETQHRAAPLLTERRPYLLWSALALCGVVIVALVVDRLRTPPDPAEDIGAPVAQLSQNLGSAVSSVTTELKARAAAASQAQQPLAHPADPQAAASAPTTAAPTAPPTQLIAGQGVAVNQSIAPATAQAEPARALPAQEAGLAQPPTDLAQPDLVQPDGASPGATAPRPSREAAAETVRNVTPSSTAVAQDDEVAQLYAHPDLAEEPDAATQSRSASAEAEQPVDLDKILKMAQDEMKNAKLEDHGVPFLADLSQQTKDGIPTIYYQKHDFSSDPSVSSVTLNGTNVRV